ncbi:MAG: autotransporter domain-containing protein [Candidatus Omnitrophica bacterium]|jgi:outer membrane autotransporter protein|nr:autotransporter domain-containing protein [Candidatus Omnitrophota bacterium]
MFYLKHFRFFTRSIFLLLFIPAAPVIILAQTSPNYEEAKAMSVQIGLAPTSWIPPASDSTIITIPGDGSTDAAYGLKYDSDAVGKKIITRTAAYQSRWIDTSPSKKYAGQTYTIYGDPTERADWVTIGNDMTNFVDTNKGSLTGVDVIKLIERGLGMDNSGWHDLILEYAVSPDGDEKYGGTLLRPVRNPDIETYSHTASNYGTNASFPDTKPAAMSDAAWANFKAYYANWYNSAVVGNTFPWTQTGYTFFWGNGSSDYTQIKGMSEFIILGGTNVTVYAMYPTQAYIFTKNDGTNLSTTAGSEYGNGFASFQVDGSCDTIWAGHRFQSKVKTNLVNNNDIIIDATGKISGGQGILVWSLNYDLDNSGEISGATSNKWGLANTSNIAVLFRGITDAESGSSVPVPATGNNTVTNSGTISSPGIAIKAEQGDTDVTNDVGGVISSGSYAILTSTLASSDDTVTLKGGEVTGSIDLGDGSDALDLTGENGNVTLNFSLDRDTATSAQLVNVETVTITDNKATLGVTLLPGVENVRDNESFLIISATTLTADASKIAVSENTSLPMVSFAPQKTGNNLYLIATRDNSYYSQNSGNSSLGNTLDGLANSGSGDMAAIIGALDSSGSASNANQLAPGINNAVNEAGYATQGQFINTIVNRIGTFLTALANNGTTGVSTGDEPEPVSGVWAEAFDTYLHQDPRGTSNGYNANVWGTSLGYDRAVLDNFVIGLNAGYANDRIRSKDNSTRTDVNSYQFGMYGNYAKGPFYMDGIFSFAYNQYDSTRRIMFNSIDRTPKGDYGGQQYSTYFEGGYAFKSKGFEITPLASFQYMHLHVNGYTEKDAEDANLTIDAQDYDFLQSGLGAKLAYPIVVNDCTFIPEFHAKWLYEFLGEAQQATSTFTGGGASFATDGFSPAKSSYNLGLKLTLLAKQNISLSFGYDFEGKSDFYSHSGRVNVRYDF